jgi:hypothetical protein
MKSKILLIPAILFAILMTNCSKTGGTGPSIKLDSDLLGNWILQTYTDDDGLQNYTGFLNIETNGNMNGEIVDIEENITAEFSGIATSENSILTTNITDSNSIWIETGIYEWDYQITGSALILEGNQDDEFLVLGFSQDGNSDEKGIYPVLFQEIELCWKMYLYKFLEQLFLH